MSDEKSVVVNPQEFDFDSMFVTPEAQSEGYDLEVLKPDGTKSGMVITLVGPDDPRRKVISQASLDRKLKSGRGRQMLRTTAAEIEQNNFDEAVAATIRWRYPKGFNGPECTPDNVMRTYKRYSDIYGQVLEAMNDLANFTKRSGTS